MAEFHMKRSERKLSKFSCFICAHKYLCISGLFVIQIALPCWVFFCIKMLKCMDLQSFCIKFCYSLCSLNCPASMTIRLVFCSLVLVFIFTVNVNKVQDFAETRKHEQEMERHMMQNVRRMAHDVMSEKRVVLTLFILVFC